MKILAALAFGILAYTLGSFLAAYFVLLFWNHSIPALFHGPVITYWQSWFIYMLCTVLFKATPSTKLDSNN